MFMANAINPQGGADKEGPSAMLNSLAKLDTSIHAGGGVQNIKLSHELFKQHLPELRALLRTFFEQGGQQYMLTVLNRYDLEQALVEPEKYKNLFVRVGGFSARFITLDRDVQQEILSRTLYYLNKWLTGIHILLRRIFTFKLLYYQCSRPRTNVSINCFNVRDLCYS